MTDVDAFGVFLARAAKTPLLTHEEEITLANQARAWLDSDNPSPSVARAGRKAKDRLIQSNIRLVVHVAKRFQRRGLEMSDLVQEGVIGLNRAIEMFSPSKGCRFSTYAYPWIRQAITRGVQEKGKAIRIPVHVGDTLYAARAIASEHYQEHGRYPTTREVCYALIARKKLKPPAYHPKGVDPRDLALAKLEHALAMSRTLASLNYVVDPGDGDGAGEIGELIEANIPSPEDMAVAIEQQELVERMLRLLTPKQRRVVSARYGLGNDSPQGFADVSREMRLDVRNVRVIHDRAMRNLRARFENSGYVELLRKRENSNG